jgi:hypothetical protein
MKDGKAEVGDVFTDQFGLRHEVVAVCYAADLIAGVTDGAQYRGSHAESCAMWGGKKADRSRRQTAAQLAARQETPV